MNNWPQPGDSLHASGPWGAQAQLDGLCDGRMCTYAYGYKEAADCVTEQVAAGEVNPDVVGYPVLYLYSHYIELMLKELMRLGWKLGFREKNFPNGTHDIRRLWSEVRPLLKQAFPDGSQAEEDAVDRCVEELRRIDPSGKGDALRYGEDNAGVQALPQLPGQQINLLNMRDVMNGIAAFLEASYDAMEELLGCQADADEEHLSAGY